MKTLTFSGFDHYRPDMVDDLQKFFDCYATGLPNGWEESTPPLRLSLLGFDGGAVPTVVERPYPQFPVPGIRYATYYLDAEHRVLSKTAIGTQGQASHESHHLTATSVRTFGLRDVDSYLRRRTSFSSSRNGPNCSACRR